MRPALIAITALAALAAAACTPMDWAKKDTAAEQAQADLRVARYGHLKGATHR